MTKHLVAALITLLLTSCSARRGLSGPPPPGFLISYGHDIGMVVGSHVAVYPSGAILLHSNGRDRWRLLDPERLEEVSQLVESELMLEAFGELTDQGYDVSCCDLEEVWIDLGDSIVGYPLDGAESLSPSVALVIHKLNLLLRETFKAGESAQIPMTPGTMSLPEVRMASTRASGGSREE